MSHLLTGTYRHRPNNVVNAGIGSDFAPSVASNTDNSSRIGTLEWANFLAAASSLDLRYLYMKEKNEDMPVRDLGLLPTFDPRNLSAMGQYVDPFQANLTVGAGQFSNTQNYQRQELRGTFNHILDLGRTRHGFKAGGGYEFAEETFNRLANGWGTILNITQDGVAALRARYYTPQPAQLGQAHTYALFVQDEVTIAPRASVNIGVLLNRDAFSQRVAGSGGCPSTIALKGGAAVYESTGDTCNFLRFGFKREIQPRVGATYQIRDGKGDEVYAHWGRYYSMDQKSSARSLAPRRVFQTQTVFDLVGNVLSSGPLDSTTGKLIDPDIEPIYTDEILVGYATHLRKDTVWTCSSCLER